jgi:uncharacterized membrane protein YtjA (UPF0391 family)
MAQGLLISSAPKSVRARHITGGNTMLHYAAVFLVIALIAAFFGFGGIASGAVEIAKILFFIFIVLFVVSIVVGLIKR